MKSCGRSIIILCIFLLAGCGSAMKAFNRDNSFLVSAEPVPVADLITACGTVSTDIERKSCLGSIGNASYKRCSEFLDGLVLTENTTNTGFDLTTILFSALATVFKPLNTIHGLSAGASVSSGWKNSINSNIYAKASIANYSQAIQATYYKDMSLYWAGLSSMSGDQLVVQIEGAKIQSIHRECSLAAAQATISATLQPPGGQANALVFELTNLVVMTATANDNLKLTASSSALPAHEIISYVVASGDDDRKVADEFLKKINASAALKAANITATATAPPSNKISLRSPATASVSWIVNNVKVLVLTSGGITTAPTVPLPTPAAPTKGAEPGHRIQ
jgi:hypothetical protein